MVTGSPTHPAFGFLLLYGMTLNDLGEFGEDTVLPVTHIPPPHPLTPGNRSEEKARPLGTFQLLCSVMVKNLVQG